MRPFVGRQAELESLRRLVAAAREGQSAALVVVGAPGLGKSSLLDRLERDAEHVRVVRVTGIETERELPYAALDALLRPVIDRRDCLPRVQAEALERALALAAGPPPDPFAVGAATLSLLAAAAEDDGGLLCVVDDAQFLDPPSLRAIAFAARRLRTEAVAVVFATRPVPETAAELRGLDELRLEGLAGAHAHELLVALSNDRIPADLADRLIDASEGNPLVLLELAGRLTKAQLEGRDALVGPLPPSAAAEDLLAATIDDLPERTRMALLVVATGERGDTTLVRPALAALGHDPRELLPAESAGLIELRPDGVAFRHPLVRSVAYHHRHTPEQRRLAHAAVAQALPPDDPRRPWHRAAAVADPDEEVAAELERAGAEAHARGGHASAATALRRAASLSPDEPQRVRRALAAVDHYELAGLNDEAAALLDETEPLTARDPVTAARLRGHRAHLRLVSGRPIEARPLLLAEGDALAPTAPVSSARFFLQAAFASQVIGDLDAWEHHSGQALAVLDAGGDGGPGLTGPLGAEDAEQTYRVALAMHGAALVAKGQEAEARPMLDSVVHDLLGLDEPVSGATEVYGLMCHALVWTERWELAERLLDRLIADARALSSAIALPYLLGVRGVYGLRLGRYATASADIEEAVTLAGATGQGIFLAGALSIRAVLGALTGGETVEADAQRALERNALAAPRMVIFPHWALGLAALGGGEPERAAEMFGRAGQVHVDVGFQEPGSAFWHADLVEALFRSGDQEGADRALARWEAEGERTGRRFVLATAARLRGLMGPDDEIDERFAEALDLHDGLPMPFERARTLLCHGERLRRARRRNDARAPLREALDAFERLPAPAWAVRARSELRATGGMVPAVAKPELAELTAHEVQVAMLVAEGRTNREVAAALFLAPKTIEHHLSTIFRKLGVRRRTELARLFAGQTERSAAA